MFVRGPFSNLIAAILLTFSALAFGESSGTGLQLSVAGDLVGSIDAGAKGGAANRLDVREAEVMLYAPIDHLFDGVVSLAAHQEEGELTFEVHETYIGSTRLIPRSRFRVGQFFLGFGRLNQFHRHDWPFTSAPKVQRDFFGDEGVLDTGVEYSWLTPLPFYLDLTFGITNGWVFGHAHGQGTKAYVPTHYLHATTSATLSDTGVAQIGLSYIGRKDSDAIQSTYLGLDATAKWRESARLVFLFQNEFWIRLKRPRIASGSDSEDALGFYLYPQYGFSPNWMFGVRFDGYSMLSRTDGFGNSAKSFDYAFVPTLTYKASEFSTIRASFQWGGTRADGVISNQKRYFEAQAVFILGTHPAHDF